ncbi:MAG: hypothetical protein ACJ780_13830 [Solirubrobacteraceae bacterium]
MTGQGQQLPGLPGCWAAPYELGLAGWLGGCTGGDPTGCAGAPDGPTGCATGGGPAGCVIGSGSTGFGAWPTPAMTPWAPWEAPWETLTDETLAWEIAGEMLTDETLAWAIAGEVLIDEKLVCEITGVDVEASAETGLGIFTLLPEEPVEETTGVAVGLVATLPGLVTVAPLLPEVLLDPEP